MFLKMKNKENNLVAPVSGKVIMLEEVHDAVFSQKMLGDGFAIDTNSVDFVAPCDGVLSVMFPTAHAYGITTKNGMEILIHIGIDTVNENGVGFYAKRKLNDKIKQGEHIVTIDKKYLEEKGYDLTTMIIFTNEKGYSEFSCEYNKQVEAGEYVAKYK